MKVGRGFERYLEMEVGVATMVHGTLLVQGKRRSVRLGFGNLVGIVSIMSTCLTQPGPFSQLLQSTSKACT